MISGWTSIVVSVLVGIVLAYGLVVWLAWKFQEKLLFFPGSPVFPHCPGLEDLNGSPIESEFSGEKIRGFYFPKAEATTTILLFHGNGGNACDRINYVQGLLDSPVNIFLAEYPGYAGSNAKLGETSFLRNAEALVRWWQAKFAPSHDLIFFGESLGTGIVSHLASKFSARLLVLHSPYDSISNVAKHHYPWLPINRLIRHPFDSRSKLQLSKTPLIIFHGDQDRIIPISHAEALYRSIPIGVEKRFERFPGREHNNLWVGNASYWNSLEEEIAKRIKNVQ